MDHIGENHYARPESTGGARLEPDRNGSVRGLSTSGFHWIAYTDWGPPDAETTVICVHGLTRQGRAQLNAETAAWLQFVSGVSRILLAQ